MARYHWPIGEHRWSHLSLGPLPKPSLDLPERAGEPPKLLSTRPGPRSSDLDQSRRSRILLATADTALRSGYAASTLTDITARARINKPAFYEYFRDKRHAFLVIHELSHQRSMRVGAVAYFSVEQWPERVWHCLLATSLLQAAHATIAHVGYLETQALGLPAIQRVDESRHAFATLLRTDRQDTSLLPGPTAAEAIGAAIFELAHDLVRHQRAKDLPRYAYHATYLALAPFLGVEAANRFVEQKLNDAKKHERPATKPRGGA